MKIDMPLCSTSLPSLDKGVLHDKLCTRYTVRRQRWSQQLMRVREDKDLSNWLNLIPSSLVFAHG